MPIHGTVWTRALSTIESHSDAKVHSLVQQRPKHRRNLGFGLHDPSRTKIIPSEFRPKLRQICPPQLIQSVWPGVWLHCPAENKICKSIGLTVPTHRFGHTESSNPEDIHTKSVFDMGFYF